MGDMYWGKLICHTLAEIKISILLSVTARMLYNCMLRKTVKKISILVRNC